MDDEPEPRFTERKGNREYEVLRNWVEIHGRNIPVVYRSGRSRTPAVPAGDWEPERLEGGTDG